MNITREDIDELNAVLKISIKPGDYQEQVDTILRDYRKKANIPGFRQGKVPIGMVKKQYGTAIKSDEINKLISNSLGKYIEDNKINLLGDPLPKKDEQNEIDIVSQDEFEFSFDVGLSPEFNLTISNKDKFTVYDIQVDDKILNEHITDICKRFGKISAIEESASEDMLRGEFIELENDESVKEDGIKHVTTIAIEYIEDENAKKTLTGLKSEDKIILDPKTLSKGDADLAAMLGIEKQKLSGISNKFQFRVTNIYKMNPATVDQELFDKVFGTGNVKSEDEFRKKVSDEIAVMLKKDSDRKLQKDMVDALIEKTKIMLPDEFLKRWLITSNEKTTSEQIDNEYDNFALGLKWQLIQGKIVKENNIKVEQEEVLAKAKILISQQLLQYGQADIDDNKLTEYANNLLEKEEERKRIFQQLFDEKVMDLLKNTFQFKNKEVAYDEFVKLATAKTSKPKLFENISNMLKF